jgi:hypothetical protein
MAIEKNIWTHEGPRKKEKEKIAMSTKELK